MQLESLWVVDKFEQAAYLTVDAGMDLVRVAAILRILEEDPHGSTWHLDRVASSAAGGDVLSAPTDLAAVLLRPAKI